MRTSQLHRRAPQLNRRAISPASPAQRAKVADQRCIVCGGWNVEPAHVIDRAIGGDDHPHAVVALCLGPNGCHRKYDAGKLDLLPHLEPEHRRELAYAVYTVGLVRALERITNERWSPENDARRFP